ncbi:putative methyl-accepting chemotaxis protein YoaH [compost metagenome]
MFNSITRSVSRKLTLIVFCIMLILSLTNAGFAYKSIRDLHYDNIRSVHETDAFTTKLISAYIVGFLDKAKTGVDMKEDTNLKTLISIFDSMTQKELVNNAYVFFPDKETRDGKEYLKMMSSNTSLAAVLPSMSDYELPEIFSKGFSKLDTTEIVLTDTYSDDNGTYISTLSKITDPAGKLIAIFGLDFDYGLVNEQLQEELISSISIALVMGILFSVLIWYLVSRQLAPLKELTEATNRASHGDFSSQLKVTRGDEFGRLKHNFNTMLVSVSSLIKDISISTEQVVASSQQMKEGADQSLASSQEITNAVQQIATSAEAQSQSTAESKRAIEEMAVGVQRIAESAGQVTEHIMGVADETTTNQQLMNQTVEQMENINESTQVSLAKLQHLLERSADIKGIITIISDIAKQTNLLSLNASIEAARAGEHGRGFAVVAGEIRKLAEQSKQSSDGIAELITGINHDTLEISQTMKSGAEEAIQGAEIVKRAQVGFERIAQSVQSITSQVQEVSAATEELSAGSEEIAATMEELARISQMSSNSAQGIASSVEQQLSMMDTMAGSAQELKQTANQVKSNVAKFTV